LSCATIERQQHRGDELMPPDEVTLGELRLGLAHLSEGLTRLEQNQSDQFRTLNQKVDTLAYVPRGEYQVQMGALIDKFAVLEASHAETKESLKYARRTGIGAFIALAITIASAMLVIVR
jgi:hypothetical protein